MNEDKIKDMYDKIHAPENLKKETMEKMKNENPKKFNYKYILSMAALFVFALTAGTLYYTNKKETEVPNIAVLPEETSITIETESPDLLHFQSVEDVRNYFKETYETNNRYFKDIAFSTMTNGEQMKSAEVDDLAAADVATTESASETKEKNFYQTNTQVENVDEADIVKTDGDYIYYVTNSSVYIVKAETLNLDAQISFARSSNSEENYYPSEVFLKEDKLIVIGNYTKYIDYDGIFARNIRRTSNINTTKAYIYDISDKTDPKELRQVDIDGNYDTSRLVGDTLYLIGTKSVYYTKDLKDDDILPVYYDSAFSNEYKALDCKHIVYKEDTSDSIYKTIGAININATEQMAIESFLGYGDTVYCSENNLYLTVPIYNSSETDSNVLNKTEIYKFSISGGGLKYSCKTEINGDVNDQFSLDEYNGNLRIATTATIEEVPDKTTTEDGVTTVEIGKRTKNNILYVLDENLNKISELTDFGITEKIYSVRFIKDVAYIVTFKEIDPLFVIDLSDPTNPVMKGELEIPGYSSYLHPYDENHIIGIGYNVKQNGFGGVSNETVKLSMFDVSDLENPKEIFTKTLGEEYSYSDVTRDHKLLMYDGQRNLMGFPISMRNKNYKYEDAIVILEIDLEGNEFKIHSKYTVDNFTYYIRKVIYIEDTLYILCGNEILAFDINTLDNIGKLDLPYERQNATYNSGLVTIDSAVEEIE